MLRFPSKHRQPQKVMVIREPVSSHFIYNFFKDMIDLSYIVPCTIPISAQQFTKEEIQKTVRKIVFIIKFVLTSMLYPGLFKWFAIQKTPVQRWKGRRSCSKEPTFSKRTSSVSFHPLYLSKEPCFQ